MIITHEHNGIYVVKASEDDIVLNIVSFNTETNEAVITMDIPVYNEPRKIKGTFKQNMSCILHPDIRAYNVKTGLPVLRRNDKLDNLLSSI